MSGSIIENDYKYFYEAFLIDDPFKVGFRFTPSRAGTCRDGVMFAKEAQNLFQHKLRKQKTFGLLQSEKHLPRINVFWTFVNEFVDT